MTWNPFKKDKAQEPVEEESPAKTVGKGRPTPKMKQAQARNLRPLVPPDRKASAKAKDRASSTGMHASMNFAVLPAASKNASLPSTAA